MLIKMMVVVISGVEILWENWEFDELNEISVYLC